MHCRGPSTAYLCLSFPPSLHVCFQISACLLLRGTWVLNPSVLLPSSNMACELVRVIQGNRTRKCYLSTYLSTDSSSLVACWQGFFLNLSLIIADVILFFSFSKHQTQNTKKVSDLPNVNRPRKWWNVDLGNLIPGPVPVPLQCCLFRIWLLRK